MTPAEEDAIAIKFSHDFRDMEEYDAIRLAIRAAVAQESQWREAVLNELIVAHIYTKEHETNPLKAIRDAITWNCQVALDPAVSSDAQRLRDTYLQRAEAAERELAAMKAENSELRSALEIVHFKREPWQ